MSASLIERNQTFEGPCDLSEGQLVCLAELYVRYGVVGGTPREKIDVLQKEIQARSFFAFGGEETEDMELRANELIYLAEHGCL